MNGIIRHAAREGLWLITILAMVGCNTLQVMAPGHVGCTSCGLASQDVSSCPQCPGGAAPCANLNCGQCGARLPDCVKDFDYEQLHPDHCWPSQYARESARRVLEPFGQQLLNGNAIELTMWTHYFSTDEDSEHELNQAGRARLEYLARKRPFVIPDLRLQTSFDKELDQKRIASIVEFASDVSFQPVAWNVTIVNEATTGLFGSEGPRAIDNMIGPPGGGPYYEKPIKPGFFSGAGGS